MSRTFWLTRSPIQPPSRPARPPKPTKLSASAVSPVDTPSWLVRNVGYRPRNPYRTTAPNAEAAARDSELRL